MYYRLCIVAAPCPGQPLRKPALHRNVREGNPANDRERAAGAGRIPFFLLHFDAKTSIHQFVQTGSGQTWGETLRQEGFFGAGATKRQRWLQQQQQRVLLRVRQPAAAGAGA